MAATRFEPNKLQFKMIDSKIKYSKKNRVQDIDLGSRLHSRSMVMRYAIISLLWELGTERISKWLGFDTKFGAHFQANHKFY